MKSRSLGLLGISLGWGGFLALFLRVFLAGGQIPRTHDHESFWLWACLGALAAVALFFGAFWLLRKARMLEDMPTSRIRSAAQGYVEFEGRAGVLPGPPIVSPLSRQHCAWWSYRVRHYDANSREWETIEDETSSELFTIIDDTGYCIVDPAGADVSPSLSRIWRGKGQRPGMIPKKSPLFSFGDYSYTEKQIAIGDPLYALGAFRTQSAILEMNESRDTSELLAQWKRDKKNLMERFDTNRDGQIDMAEWEAARRAAGEQVRTEHVQQSLTPDVSVLSKPMDRKPYILSTITQDQLTLRYRAGAILCLLTSLAIAVALFLNLGHH